MATAWPTLPPLPACSAPACAPTHPTPHPRHPPPAPQSSAKRQAIRDTWGAVLRSRYGRCMALLFVLAQPPAEQHPHPEALAVLEPEVAQGHADIAFVPGLVRQGWGRAGQQV